MHHLHLTRVVRERIQQELDGYLVPERAVGREEYGSGRGGREQSNESILAEDDVALTNAELGEPLLDGRRRQLLVFGRF